MKVSGEEHAFMEMHSSLKKRCCADQKSLNTSLLCPVSSTA